MGKLVKYCSECEEGFAERFGFCPNCGGHLEAFEMKPVAAEAETEVETESFAEAVESAPEAVEAPQAAEAAVIPETLDFSGDDILELDSVDTRETAATEENIEKEPETPAETVPAFSANDEVFGAETPAATSNFQREVNDDEYHVTVVSQKASSWFAPFFLSLLALGFFGAIASYAIAIMIYELGIPSLGDSEYAYSIMTDEVPLNLEELQKKRDGKAGGGGGGGNENEDPASKGRIPDHSDNPTQLTIVDRMSSDLQIYNRVNSKVNREDDNTPVGGGTGDKRSGGGGSGGGIGTGLGTGIGSGQNSGVGTGRNGGTGGGANGGIGDNDGPGLDGDDRDSPQLVKKVGENKPLNITSKPTAKYTNEARQANFTGTVRLKVTFNANGTIGSVVAVNSVGYGLTEQAIAAAKQMRFEPAMRNGQKVSVTRVVEYSFTLY